MGIPPKVFSRLKELSGSEVLVTLFPYWKKLLFLSNDCILICCRGPTHCLFRECADEVLEGSDYVLSCSGYGLDFVQVSSKSRQR